jgi:hypothetical protein
VLDPAQVQIAARILRNYSDFYYKPEQALPNGEIPATWVVDTSVRSERVRWDWRVSNLFLQTHEVKEKENRYSNGAERSIL